jgi:hypothetical protein
MNEVEKMNEIQRMLLSSSVTFLIQPAMSVLVVSLAKILPKRKQLEF